MAKFPYPRKKQAEFLKLTPEALAMSVDDVRRLAGDEAARVFESLKKAQLEGYEGVALVDDEKAGQ
ncbi:hypothetical protein [Anaeromyxobacter sp. Fw109-5]|uniref:hypothetical protein n=1 Tax=Anaeromyxobacter sp. (strain Fw109-5) TaxID=404589 RepID=UPI0000ED7337|nr:hypothetical protein [Anaeromyxobacter sp. Fw109-5]ABS26852.1 hypothetical protein Anae109_2651 [Anaeromyxobacter sp. Fw109-5]